MRGDQLARQWQLIQHLAKSRAGIGLDELARELDCVKRTVYRDLDALMYAGFPVKSEKRDGRAFYSFLDSYRLGDVPFTPDELLALAFSEDLLRVLEGTVFHDSIASALAKIRAGLGPELTNYLSRMTDTFRVIPGPHKRYAQFADTIRMLNDAVLSQQTVAMKYRTGRSGAESERGLDPYRVWYRSGGLYVIGHDHQSGEIRTFAIDRIVEIEATDKSFEVAPSFDFDTFVSSAFGVISETPVAVRIRFDSDWKNHVMEHTWHPSQKIAELPDGDLELTMEVGGTTEVRNWVMSFGAGAEVIEPSELRADVITELERVTARYSPS
ncbi:MAG TPA: WYL domain-containing protein [Myxococcales bacterium]|nr:WYL domain-containing protein [Myxococcales bacterium]HIM02446.1 WYL domain-containing protein [Myxococcales bacterium]